MTDDDQLREFLARAIPWPQEGEAQHHCGIHWLSKSKTSDKPFWTGRAARTVDEAVRNVRWAQKLEGVTDIYVAMGAQRTAQPRTSAAGHQYLLPMRSQDNVVSLRSLFLDIDCKDGPNGYATQAEAAAALGAFLREIGLSRPTIIVSSGGGLHCHWVLSRALPPREWKPLAMALAEATKRHGLKCDTQVTIDSARILRPPQTFNYKQETPRPTRIVGKTGDDFFPERMKEILAPYMEPAKEAPPLPVLTPIVQAPELAMGVEQRKAPPITLEQLSTACPFVNEAVTTGGKDYSNPLWNLTTLIAAFTADGRDAAHKMADQHAGYTQQSTDELYDRKEREKEQRGLGWPHCSTISGTGSLPCGSCAHKNKNKTPFHAALIPPPAPVNQKARDWDLPAGYIRDQEGRIHRVLVQQDGSTELAPVMGYPMTDPWLQKNPWILNFSTISYAGHSQQVAMPFAEALVAGGIRTVLGKQGLAIRGVQVKMVEEFIVSWIEKLQTMKDSVVQSAPFGWSVKNGKTEGFIYGGQLWSAGAPKPAAVGDPVVAAAYTPTGEPEPWHEAAELITSQGRPALDAVLASAFAAPLVKFTGQPGVMMSLYSTASGIGKTTALKVAQAVWGDPIRAMQGLDDTQLSVINKIGNIKALPMYWDELKTEEDTKKFVNLMFTMTRGVEKSRLRQDATQRTAGSWQTMMVSASNESLIDFVINRTKQTPAGLMRTFEYEVPSGTQGQIEVAAADQIVGRLNDNYGHVGLEYAKWLGANFKQIEADVVERRKRVELALKVKQEERFWAIAVAVLLQGAHYANTLGHTDINEPELEKFLYQVVENMRGTLNATPNDMSKGDNVENVLSQYLNAMASRHTLWTNMVPLGKGRPPKDIRVLRDASKLDGIYVHIGVDNKILRLSSTHFRQWMREAGYSQHVFMRSLEDKYGAKIVNGRIGGGTDKAVLTTEYLIEIQLAGTPMAKVLEGEV